MADAEVTTSGVTVVDGAEGKPVAHVIVPNTASAPVAPGAGQPAAAATDSAAKTDSTLAAKPAAAATPKAAVAAGTAKAAGTAETPTSVESVATVAPSAAAAGRARVPWFAPSAVFGGMLAVLDWILGVIDRPFARLGRGVRGVIGLTALGTLALSGAAVALRPVLFPVYDIGAALQAAVVEASKPPPVEADAGGHGEEGKGKGGHGDAGPSSEGGGGAHGAPKSGGGAHGASGHH